MAYGNGIASYLAGPGGRFDLSDPSTQAMVKDVMGSPANAPKYGISLQEVLQLHNLLNRISVQTPQPKPTTVVDELKMAAFQAVQSPNAAPPQAQQMPPQGIQQAMPQPQMPAPPMDQGLGGMPAPALDNAQFAGGGIVAFADTGLVGVPPGAPPEGVSPFSGTSKELYEQIRANQLAQKAAFRVPTLQEAMEEERVAREAAGVKGKLGEERIKKLEADKGKDAEAEARSERLALAKAGFKMAEAASRRGAARTGFLGAAAEGATAGLTDYAASQEKLRALQAERDKELANIQNLQRAEALGFVKNASGKIEKAQNHLLDIEKNITTTQVSIAGQMSAAERSQAEIEARAKEAAANRGVQFQIAKMQAAGQPLDVQRIMEMPQFNAAHGDKDPETRLKLATELLAGRKASPEKTENAIINATKTAATEWNKRTGLGGDLSQLINRTKSKDPQVAELAKAQLENARQQHYRGYNLSAPSLGEEAALVSGKPVGAEGSVLKFDKQGNPLR